MSGNDSESTTLAGVMVRSTRIRTVTRSLDDLLLGGGTVSSEELQSLKDNLDIFFLVTMGSIVLCNTNV